jgi:hypothetical protein
MTPPANGNGSRERLVIDRINRAILNFIRKKGGAKSGPLVCDAAGLKLMDGEQPAWSVAWGDVVRITALQYPGFVGDTITLAIEAKDHSRVVNEEQAGWAELVASLPAHLPGARRHEEWALELIAGGRDAKVAVFARA